MVIFWKIVYVVYPPLLRILEKVRIHSFRQDYLLGHLHPEQTTDRLANFLKYSGYENAILAWRDPGEVMSMRKIDKGIYQYHLRLFDDGEIRGHYEYSSEGNPWADITESCFENRKEEFESLLKDYLKISPNL